MFLWEYRENANNTKGLKVFQQFLADRTATQYDRLLASSCCQSVCLSDCLWRCAFWLSGLVYMAKSCNSVFL